MRQIGKYKIFRQLAVGGIARIYLGELIGPMGFRKKVVLKRLHDHLAGDSNAVRMFLGEARLLARFSHPNIVQLYDLFIDDGCYCMAIEAVDGCDFEAMGSLARSHRLRVPLPIALYLIHEVCRALDYVHHFQDENGRAMGLVHRDISPQNLLLSRTGDVKLIDFGVAKATELDVKTEQEMIKGKFAYMSPEQCRNQRLDARSDVFSLGVVMHELLTGRHLFAHDNVFAVISRIIEGPVPPPSALIDDIPGDVEQIVTTALARDLASRFNHVEAMRRAIAAALQNHAWHVTPDDVGKFFAQIYQPVDGIAGSPLDDLWSDTGLMAIPTGEVGSDEATRVGAPAQVVRVQDFPEIWRHNVLEDTATGDYATGEIRRGRDYYEGDEETIPTNPSLILPS